MLAYASYHKRGVSMRRNRPLIGFPCFEIVASASILLMTGSGSISTPSLSDRGKPVNCFPSPRQAMVSRGFLPAYPGSLDRRTGLPVPFQADVGDYGSSVPMQGKFPCLGHPVVSAK